MKLGTCSVVSHAILMVDGQNGIEATGSGVGTIKLSQILLQSESAFLLRHNKITHVQALQVAKFVQNQTGKKYDSLGAVRSAASSGCGGIWRFSAIGQAIIVSDEAVKKLLGGNDGAFYCSELVARAFELAGALISNFGAHAVHPVPF